MIAWLCHHLGIERRPPYRTPDWFRTGPLGKVKSWNKHLTRDRNQRQQELEAGLRAAFILHAGRVEYLPFDADLFIATVSHLLLGHSPGDSHVPGPSVPTPGA